MSGLAKHGHQNHQALIPDIMTMGTPAVSALAYAKDVKDLAVRRNLQAMGTRVQQLAEAPDATPPSSPQSHSKNSTPLTQRRRKPKHTHRIT